MNKFKVGDIITGTKYSNVEYCYTNQNMTRGEVIEVLDDRIEVMYLEGVEHDVIGCVFTVDPDFFKLVESSKEETKEAKENSDEEWHSEFLIETSGNEVRLYSFADETEYYGRFDPDHFVESIVDFIDRAFTEEDDEGINGRYICVSRDTSDEEYLTIGKIYTFVDGQFTTDTGDIFPLNNRIRNEEELNMYFSGKAVRGSYFSEHEARFVKIVE